LFGILLKLRGDRRPVLVTASHAMRGEHLAIPCWALPAPGASELFPPLAESEEAALDCGSVCRGGTTAACLAGGLSC